MLETGINGYTLRVPWYDVAGYRVWGATAILLSELNSVRGTRSTGERDRCKARKMLYYRM